MGLVIELEIPYENGRTDNVIIVWFENYQGRSSMKFKDLEPVPVGSL